VFRGIFKQVTGVPFYPESLPTKKISFTKKK